MNHPLILLFGMPRSGTTWLGKIFDSHPDTLYRHEPDSQGRLDTLPLLASAGDAERYRSFLEKFAKRLPSIRDEKISASLPVFAKSYYSPYQLALRKMLVLGTKVASRHLRRLPVPNMTNIARHRQVSVVWKSVDSLGRLGVLAHVYSRARCIIIFRHPCGYIASMLRGEATRKFAGDILSSEDWGEYKQLVDLPAAKEKGFDLQTVQSMTEVERLSLKWALYYEHALDETAGMDNVISVRYEDFCESPREETRKAFQHCRLAMAPCVEHFIASSTSREDSAYYSVFKDPKVAAWKWKKELTSSQMEQVMSVVRQFKSGERYAPV